MNSPLILPVNGPGGLVRPELEDDVFLAPTAQIIGDVKIGRGSSVWFNAVLRGDVGPIRIGAETNVQDGSVLHGTFGKAFVTVGNRVTIGHSVVLHGCDVGDLVLIGMGSVVMDKAYVPSRSIVGAGSLVTEGARFESGWLIMGRPAKAVRPLKAEEIAFLDKSADNYLRYKLWYGGADAASTSKDAGQERPEKK